MGKRNGPDLFTLRCSECDRVMITTPSGYLSCPRGHGKLRQAESEPLDGQGDLFVEAAPAICCHCASDLTATAIAAGTDHCERCLAVLARAHA